MENIAFIHTTGSWWDHRYYFKQMPALKEEGYNITYVIKEDKTIEDVPYNLVTLSPSKIKWARRTGGLNLFFKLKKLRQEALQICNIELLPVGILLALTTPSKIFYDCREDHYHAMLHSKVWFPMWFRKILAGGVKVLEYLASKTFTGFIVSDPAIYKFHTAMDNSKKMIFYNMALKKQFANNSYNSNKKYDFTVLGSMSVRTGVANVVEAIGKLKDQGINASLKLIGDPAFDKVLYKEIRSTIKEYEIQDQITVTGRVPYFDIPFQLNDCRIGVIPLLDIPKFQNNIATKQFEYMASGMPVLASYLKPQRIFIENQFNGSFFEPGNVVDLVEKMAYLMKNPDEVTRMGENAKFKAESEWNAEIQQKKYVEFYKNRLKNKLYIESQIPSSING